MEKEEEDEMKEEEMKEEVKEISILLIRHDSKLSRGFGTRIQVIVPSGYGL